MIDKPEILYVVFLVKPETKNKTYGSLLYELVVYVWSLITNENFLLSSSPNWCCEKLTLTYVCVFFEPVVSIDETTKESLGSWFVVKVFVILELIVKFLPLRIIFLIS
ncbi:hypothetical protein NWE59_06140 [Mycoplasmopsis felis]|nr:hypothetical protein [Mycoplasmopsis felis]UWV78425.1 hypothetical protein NWE59_06140 [Mycoplasmopsis felis]UWW00440.1 hypothetical protein NW064_04110 [Mycoplasmopsis felis]